MRLHLRLAATGLVALTLAACGGSAATEAPAATDGATTAPATEAPATEAPATEAAASDTAGRTGRIEVADQGFALTLPDSWVEITLSGDDVDSILSAFPEGTFSGDMESMMRTAIESGIKLWGFDTNGDGSNVNVLVQPTPAPLDQLEPLLPAELETIPGSSNLQVTRGTVNGQDAIIATYDLSNALADGSVSEMTGTQAYLSTDTNLYIVTVSLAKGNPTDPMDILNSIELLP